MRTGPIPGDALAQDVDDGQLLRRYVEHRDEAAFSAVVERHHALVLGVAGRILRSPADAEDAAQAVFLTLARKATRLTRTPSVAGWLHHVARCVARTALAARSSRNRHESRAAVLQAQGTTDGPNPVVLDDLRSRLDRELARLPARYREPLILVHLEGRSLEETARILRRPRGTIGACLSRGRALLRTRLGGRGSSLGEGDLAVVLARAVVGAASADAGRAGTVHATTPAMGSSFPTTLTTAPHLPVLPHWERLATLLRWAPGRRVAVGLAWALLISGVGWMVTAHSLLKGVSPVTTHAIPRPEALPPLQAASAANAAEAVAGKITLRLYEVEDLLTPVPDAWSLTRISDGGQAGAAVASHLISLSVRAHEDQPASLHPQQLIEFIKQHVAPPTWDGASGTTDIDIDIKAGHVLFVVQTDTVHDQLQRLLANLRHQRLLMVQAHSPGLDLRRHVPAAADLQPLVPPLRRPCSRGELSASQPPGRCPQGSERSMSTSRRSAILPGPPAGGCGGNRAGWAQVGLPGRSYCPHARPANVGPIGRPGGAAGVGPSGAGSGGPGPGAGMPGPGRDHGGGCC